MIVQITFWVVVFELAASETFRCRNNAFWEVFPSCWSLRLRAVEFVSAIFCQPPPVLFLLSPSVAASFCFSLRSSPSNRLQVAFCNFPAFPTPQVVCPWSHLRVEKLWAKDFYTQKHFLLTRSFCYRIAELEGSPLLKPIFSVHQVRMSIVELIRTGASSISNLYLAWLLRIFERTSPYFPATMVSKFDAIGKATNICSLNHQCMQLWTSSVLC